MADQSVVRKNQIYIIATSLVSQADTNVFQNLPTLAVGDARLNTFDGAVWSGWGNTTNAPAQNGERGIIITLTAAEMNNDIVHVVLDDVAGAEWQDQAWILHPSDDTLPVLSTEIAAVAGDTWDEARAAHVGALTFGEGVASVAGSVGSVAAGGIAAVSFAANAIDAAALATDAAQEIADTTLGRDLGAVVGAAARSLREGIRFLRNRWRIAGGILFVYEEDDLTIAWQGPATTAASDPVVEIDPA